MGVCLYEFGGHLIDIIPLEVACGYTFGIALDARIALFARSVACFLPSATTAKYVFHLTHAFAIAFAAEAPTRIFSNGTGCSVRIHSPLKALMSQSLSPGW